MITHPCSLWFVVTDVPGIGARRPPGVRLVENEDAARREVERVCRAKGWVLIRMDISHDQDGRGARFVFGEVSSGPAIAEIHIGERVVQA